MTTSRVTNQTELLAALKTARRAKPGHNKGVFTMANEDDVIRRVKEIIADRLDRKMEELSDDARIMACKMREIDNKYRR